jgi:hypothetical protein
MTTVKFKGKIAKMGNKRVINVPFALFEMVDLGGVYLVSLKPIREGDDCGKGEVTSSQLAQRS